MKHAATTALIFCASAQCLATDGDGIWTDPAGDAVIRRTDPGADAPLPPGYVPIDLLKISLRGWTPDTPADPYTGAFRTDDAHFFRLDVTLAGVVAPPGPGGFNGFDYDPYRYGDRPFFGYIELDVDDQKNSGGELTPLAFNRYLANVGRFGLSPNGSISERMVRSADDLNTSFFIGPQFERTGGEFSLAMCGCWEPLIVSQNGNSDFRFDAGETWIVEGRFFERFQSMRTESVLFGGSEPGMFDPVVRLRFRHDPVTDTTTVSLVFPITQEGAAFLADEPQQPMDFDITNHTSIEEALADLIESAEYATGPLGELLDPWEGRDYDDYRRPRQWGVTALIGTMPLTEQPGAPFIWTDTGFGEHFADLNDDDVSNGLDRAIILAAIADMDGTSADADGTVDGRVTIPNFGPAFDLRDLDANGVIDHRDAALAGCPADIAEPFGIVNFFDLARFIALFQKQDPAADLNADGVLNFFDFSDYLAAFNTPCD